MLPKFGTVIVIENSNFDLLGVHVFSLKGIYRQKLELVPITVGVMGLALTTKNNHLHNHVKSRKIGTLLVQEGRLV